MLILLCVEFIDLTILHVTPLSHLRAVLLLCMPAWPVVIILRPASTGECIWTLRFAFCCGFFFFLVYLT